MKKTILVFCMALICFNTSAQMGVLGKKAAKQIELLKDRTMLVVLWDDDELDGYNENIKKAIDDVWTFSNDIKYVTKDEWRELSKNKDEREKYTNLYYTTKMLNANAPNHSLVFGLLEKKVSTHFIFTPKVGLADLMLSLKNMQLDLEIGNNYKKVVKEQRTNFINYAKDNLPNMTLYIDKDMVTKKLIKNIEKTYPYPYKLVSYEDINAAILSKDPNVLFIREFVKAQRPMTKTRETANNVAYSKMGSMNFAMKMLYRTSDLKLVGGTGPGDKIDIKDLEMLLKVMKM
ncbi:hypothetical protein [Psychroserpens sp. MEBiC05023]